MSDEVTSFVFYKSFYDAISCMDSEKAFLAFRVLNDYAFAEQEPCLSELPEIVRIFFVMAKPQIDANRKRREDGRRGGRPKVKESTGCTEPSGVQACDTVSTAEATAPTLSANPKSTVAAEPSAESAPEVMTAPPVPAQTSSAFDAWCKTHGFVFDVSDSERMKARMQGVNAADYLDFTLRKIKELYPNRNDHELRLLMRNALITWHNLRGEFTSYEAECAKKLADNPPSPETCPKCGKRLNRALKYAPSCTCGFYTLEGGKWLWNEKTSAIPLSAKEFMKRKSTAESAPREEGVQEFDIF